MPISSYPRITLEGTAPENNPLSGTGLSLLDNLTNEYRVANSDLFPINSGGLASENTAGQIVERLTAVDFTNESAGNILYQILTELQTLNSSLANGTGAIQIIGGGNIANVSSTNKLDVRL
jgi:hypothetical protein